MSNDQLTQWLIEEIQDMRKDIKCMSRELEGIRARRTIFTGLVSLLVSGTITILASLFANKV